MADAGSLELSYGSSNTSGNLNFTGGNITFTKVVGGITQGSLTINAQPYVLANSVGQLAADITSNPNGFYALANNYNASGDGIYSSAPIISFAGTFNGLGNAISNLTIVTSNQHAGLFGQVDKTGQVLNLGLIGGSVTDTLWSTDSIDQIANVGALAGHNLGKLTNVYATGSVSATGNYSLVGGLVGFNDGGTIINAHATGNVNGAIPFVAAGGLVGINLNGGIITNSYATGSVSGKNGFSGGMNLLGGLVGVNYGSITNSYATGSVTGGDFAYLGGLVGANFTTNGKITNSYATGAVTGGNSSYVGGLIGYNDHGIITSSYATGIVTGGLGALIGSLIGFNVP
ncbi:MAG: hypothetical protein NVS3B3_18820 [Aquirhabdus sp.]